MDLATGIYIHDPVDIDTLYSQALSASLLFDDRHRSPMDFEPITVPEDRRDGVWVRFGRSEYNAPANVAIWYRDHAPLQTQEEADNLARICPHAPDCAGQPHSPAHHVLLAFNTSSGYHDSRGWSCVELHASLVGVLGGFLDTAGVRWSWTNEIICRIETGYDALEEMKTTGGIALRGGPGMVIDARALLMGLLNLTDDEE